MQAIGSNGDAQQHRWLCTAFAADTRHVSTTQIFQERTVRWCAAERSLLRSTNLRAATSRAEGRHGNQKQLYKSRSRMKRLPSECRPS